MRSRRYACTAFAALFVLTLGAAPARAAYDGGTFANVTPATHPSARAAATAAFDAAHGYVILFGGLTDDFTALADTWKWDGSAWTQLTPAASPSARGFASMAYDEARGEIIMFGGVNLDTGPSDDMWRWDGTTWVPVTGVQLPPSRIFANMAYHAASSSVVLFGGFGDAGELDDTWTWNGTAWTHASTPVKPRARDGHMMAADPVAGNVVLFGGEDEAERLLHDTWTWNGTAWSRRGVATLPSPRLWGSMAFDRNTNTTVLFGGGTATADLSDVWSWTGSKWIARAPASTPPARVGAPLVFDPNIAPNGALLLAGGASDSTLADTWSYTLARSARTTFDHAFAFGRHLIGTTSAQTVTLTNAGPLPLHVSAATVNGADAARFELTATTCTSGEIAVAATCTATVEFTPSNADGYYAALALTDDTEAGTTLVPMSGAGQPTTVGAPPLASLASSTAAFNVRWANRAPDVTTYDVEWAQRVKNGSAWMNGPWTAWKTATATTSATFGGPGEPVSAQGETYVFRARAHTSTETGPWSVVAMTVVPLDDVDSALRYGSGWTQANVASRYFGTMHHARGAHSMSLAADAHGFTIIGDRCPSCGAFTVYVDGARVATVNTFGKHTSVRRVLFAKTLPGTAPHTLRIVTARAPERPNVRIDAVGVRH
jgi:hypothetical protein